MTPTNVLVIESSPRAHGNSDLICDEFIRGAREAGHAVEKYALRDHELNYCRACYACFRTGKCVIKDCMAELRDIFGGLGNKVVRTIWGERVWQKGEVLGTPAMEAAYKAGRSL